jgi:DNA-binding PadR family transcriptional regulator
VQIYALTSGTIAAYIAGMRRKPGTLLPLEAAICVAAADLLATGTAEFHGYELAKRLADASHHRLLTAYGTLYRTLGRLEQMGLVQSRWEDAEVPARENRPGRRLYALTGAGEAAARETQQVATERMLRRRRRRWVPA